MSFSACLSIGFASGTTHVAKIPRTSGAEWVWKTTRPAAGCPIAESDSSISGRWRCPSIWYAKNAAARRGWCVVGEGETPAPEEPVIANTATGAPSATRFFLHNGARPRIAAVAKHPGEATAREEEICSRKSSGRPYTHSPRRSKEAGGGP